MKGFVPTPPSIVDLMVAKLFEKVPPEPEDTLLDPGCGRGAFIDGIIRWCDQNNREIPCITGIDSDSSHLAIACEKYSGYPSIQIRHEDFLLRVPDRKFDFIIANPPYVPINGLSEHEKREYRMRFRSATGRFDLYFLFFEQALHCLEKEGRLVFITPEKYLSVKSASQLRIILSGYYIDEIDLIHEQSFGSLVTYPAITTITPQKSDRPTMIVFRDGHIKSVDLPKDGTSAFPSLYGKTEKKAGYCTLGEVCLRISCGVATGADAVFVHKKQVIPTDLKMFAFPTIAGRDLSSNSRDVQSDLQMLTPYDLNGKLIPESQLGALKNFLLIPQNHSILLKRTCTAKKPWYAFHENPPLNQILQRKILCKDITEMPFFRIDDSGGIVPGHSVYYIIPKNPDHIEVLNDYLNSREVRSWLESNCQRAANGFLRLQSTILKQVPVPLGILEPGWLSGQKASLLHGSEDSPEIAVNG
ncbi:MAG: TaqI-like C-terminal specificity domain-containing protein [Methanoregula sp.]